MTRVPSFIPLSPTQMVREVTKLTPDIEEHLEGLVRYSDEPLIVSELYEDDHPLRLVVSQHVGQISVSAFVRNIYSGARAPQEISFNRVWPEPLGSIRYQLFDRGRDVMYTINEETSQNDLHTMGQYMDSPVPWCLTRRNSQNVLVGSRVWSEKSLATQDFTLAEGEQPPAQLIEDAFSPEETLSIDPDAPQEPVVQGLYTTYYQGDIRPPRRRQSYTLD